MPALTAPRLLLGSQMPLLSNNIEMSEWNTSRNIHSSFSASDLIIAHFYGTPVVRINIYIYIKAYSAYHCFMT